MLVFCPTKNIPVDCKSAGVNKLCTHFKTNL